MSNYGINPQIGTRRGVGYNRFISGGAYINAIDFDGVNDYGQVAALVGAATPSQYTICFWVKFDVLANFKRVFTCTTTPSSETIMIQYFTPNLEIFYGTSGAGNVFLNASTGVWYHIAMVADKIGNNFKTFLSGVQVNNVTPAAHPATFVNFLLMGLVAAGNNVDGQMDEFMYFSRALTQAEIVTIVNGGIAPGGFDTTGLELYLPMNEISGVTTPDISGNGRDCTLFNGPTLVSRP